MTVVETRQKLSEPHQYRVGDKEKGIKKRNTLKKERWKYFPKEMGLTLKKNYHEHKVLIICQALRTLQAFSPLILSSYL